jgi:ribonucleoside-diphosphate reductase alpha chain
MIKINKKITAFEVVKNKNTFVTNDAPKRPKELKCDIHYVKFKGESWCVLIGLLEGKPYEVFGGLTKFIEIPKKHKHGRLVKNGKIDGIATYNLVIGEDDDPLLIKDIASAFENQNYGAFTRIISLSLRHGAAVHFICEQLSKDKYSDITSFSSIIARVLKTYVENETKTKQACPSCKSEGNLTYQEGCLTCLSCGFSKCG